MRPPAGLRTTALRRGKPLEPGPGPERRTPLARMKGLQPPVPWARTVPIPSAGPRWAREGGAPEGKSAARRDTGFSRSVKLAVRTRAGNGDPDLALCEACGKWLGRRHGQVQHRVARGSGGCTDAVINGAANAALLCGTPFDGCHGKCEARKAHLRQDAGGFWIEHGNGPGYDPRYVPILLASEHGSGMKVWLREDGSYADSPPEGAVAA